MILILYNIGIRLYYLFILFASLFNSKAKFWIKGRKDIFIKLKCQIANDNNIIWIHVASLGEFEQGRPIIEKIKKQNPKQKILLTFFSPSGYEVRKFFKGVDYVFYLPLDTITNAKYFLDIVNPVKVIFVKYEYWYHFLHELNLRNIPTYLISAIFRPEQAFFKYYGKWYRKTLKDFNHIFVQNEESKELLKNINITDVSVTGDTRFDRVNDIVKETMEIPVVKAFKSNNSLIIAGSTWDKDEEFLTKYILSATEKVRMIIAPHEIHESHIKRILKSLSTVAIRFSEADVNSVKKYKVLVIDNIGMLSALYKYGEIAYIGGGFGKGIHNILEPAGFGLPVIFGPNYKKFMEAIDMINIKAAFSYNSFEELNRLLNKLLKNELLKDTSINVNNYFKSKLGATEHIVDFV